MSERVQFFDNIHSDYAEIFGPEGHYRYLDSANRLIAKSRNAIGAGVAGSVAVSSLASPVSAAEVIVENGDSLYEIAAENLGEGSSHSDIVEAYRIIAADNNIDILTDKSGEEYAHLQAGQALEVRDDLAEIVTEIDRVVVVDKGDTLSGIISDYLTDEQSYLYADMLTKTAELNGIDLITTDDASYATIFPGQQIMLPKVGSIEKTIVQSSVDFVSSDDLFDGVDANGEEVLLQSVKLPFGSTLSEVAVALKNNASDRTADLTTDQIVERFRQSLGIEDADVVAAGSDINVGEITNQQRDAIQAEINQPVDEQHPAVITPQTPEGVIEQGFEWSHIPELADITLEDFLEPTPLILDIRFPDLEIYPRQEMTGFVYHWTAFDLNDSDPVGHLMNGVHGNEACPNGCSVQFFISEQGDIYQLAEQPNTVATHAAGLNHSAAGVEIEGRNEQDLLNNPEIFKAAVKLGYYMRSFGIPVERQPEDKSGFIGHYETDKNGKQDPGENFMEYVFAAIQRLDQSQADNALMLTSIDDIENFGKTDYNLDEMMEQNRPLIDGIPVIRAEELPEPSVERIPLEQAIEQSKNSQHGEALQDDEVLAYMVAAYHEVTGTISQHDILMMFRSVIGESGMAPNAVGDFGNSWKYGKANGDPDHPAYNWLSTGLGQQNTGDRELQEANLDPYTAMVNMVHLANENGLIGTNAGDERWHNIWHGYKNSPARDARYSVAMLELLEKYL